MPIWSAGRRRRILAGRRPRPHPHAPPRKVNHARAGPEQSARLGRFDQVGVHQLLCVEGLEPEVLHARFRVEPDELESAPGVFTVRASQLLLGGVRRCLYGRGFDSRRRRQAARAQPGRRLCSCMTRNQGESERRQSRSEREPHVSEG